MTNDLTADVFGGILYSMSESIRDMIIKEMEKQGLSCYRLSRETGIGERTLQRFVTGENDMSCERCDALMKILGLEIRRRRA